MALQIGDECLRLVRRQEQRAAFADRHHRAVIGRIQGQEFLQRRLGEFGGERYVHSGGLFHRGEIGLVGNRFEFQSEQFGLRDDVLQGLQFRHVIARLAGHPEAGIIGRQTLRLIVGDGPRDGVFAPVVGGQGEMPVAVHFVDHLQVIERGAGRGDDVAALVAPPVLLQAVVLARRGNELPEACGPCARVGHRVVGRFHQRQQGQFCGHAALFQFVDNVIKIAMAAFQELLEHRRTVQVPGLALGDQRAVQVGHGEAVSDPRPEVVWRRGEINGFERGQVFADFQQRLREERKVSRFDALQRWRRLQPLRLRGAAGAGREQ